MRVMLPVNEPETFVVREVVEEKRPQTIARMFDAIAARYDLLNHLLSGGADWYWRWRAVRALRIRPGDKVLDLCTGTGDLAIEVLRRTRASHVIGIDFAAEMLRIGKHKLARAGFRGRAPLLRGDAQSVPLADASVNAVAIAFGIRNVQTPELVCREMARVLGSGGRIAVLEFSLPPRPVVRGVYQWYFRHVLPRVGRLISRHQDAYTYLPTSVGAFFSPEAFAALLTRGGFENVRARPLTLGVVQLYVATKRPAAAAPSQTARGTV
jgi:demethylmenaquinone methyltransferase/2-methoxy-6-polyprenyl-1,4-benzoquinol methylase